MDQSFGRAAAFFVITFLLGVFVIYAQSKGQTLRGTTTFVGTTTSTSSMNNLTLTRHDDNSMCLNKNEFKRNVDDHEHIFIVMPPKAGGSSLIDFARSCYGNTADFQLEFQVPTLREQWLTQSYDIPKLHIGHVLNGNAMRSLLKGASKDSLIVYIHRDETSRLASGIKQVMQVFCDEDDLVKKVIKPKLFEISGGVHNIWTCDMFHALNENRPNLVTMNMNEIDSLQKMLAEQFCPALLARKPVHHNVATEKKVQNFVQLSSNSTRIVALDEWVLKKKSMIEYTLGFKENIGCQKNVRDFEQKLFETCSDDGFMKLSYVLPCMD
ncbi:predicted protein [Chaetoceros tenuissimus]|uniref:Uncharacterized protein n=1 Tax=Chaetoceros tenuissimus TaxID=426638 RepID=A0AAD3DER7_9STRA|nr:predicted protein [Chaetoceros tenuissimus]